MKRISVIIPFRAGEHKSRLSPMMDGSRRRRFAFLMLKGELRALAKLGMVGECRVVSPDGEALRLAEASGAVAVDEPANKGVNAAVKRGMAGVEEDCCMIIPSDLPLLGEKEVREAVALSARVDVLISPSRSFDGTNLLCFSRSSPVRLSYDADSFWNHLADAAAKGYSVGVYTGRGVIHDVDTPDDLSLISKLRINSEAVAFAREAVRGCR